jgi:hypothetical protein
MRFFNVDEIEVHPIFVLRVQLIKRGNLPAERRSSVAPEDQNDRPLSLQF